MSAEFYIYFEPEEWYLKNKASISQKLKSLSSYNRFNESEKAFYLKSPQNLDWEYDVRFFEEVDYLFFEISYHDEALKNDLIYFFKWLRTQVEIKIEDEDGVRSNW